LFKEMGVPSHSMPVAKFLASFVTGGAREWALTPLATSRSIGMLNPEYRAGGPITFKTLAAMAQTQKEFGIKGHWHGATAGVGRKSLTSAIAYGCLTDTTAFLKSLGVAGAWCEPLAVFMLSCGSELAAQCLDTRRVNLQARQKGEQTEGFFKYLKRSGFGAFNGAGLAMMRKSATRTGSVSLTPVGIMLSVAIHRALEKNPGEHKST